MLAKVVNLLQRTNNKPHPLTRERMRHNIFRGCGVAMVTPFNQDLTIDTESLRRLTSDLIENGIDFLCVLGTTAETATLTAEEQDLVVHTIQEVNKGRLPLLIGVGTNNTQAVVERLQSGFYQNVDGILVVTPYYNKPTQEGLYQHYKAIASATSLPVMLYNVPGRTGVNMTAATTLRIAQDCPNVVGIKEASGCLEQIKEIIDTAPEGFEVLSGDDSLTFELITLGAKGVISVFGNAYPRQFSNLVHATQAGNYSEALCIQRTCRPLYKPIFIDGNPAGIKSLMATQGKLQNVLRLPLVPATPATQAVLQALHEKMPLY